MTKVGEGELLPIFRAEEGEKLFWSEIGSDSVGLQDDGFDINYWLCSLIEGRR